MCFSRQLNLQQKHNKIYNKMWVVPLALVLLTALWFRQRWKLQHWQRLGVYSPPAWPMVGHFLQMMNFVENAWSFRDRIYKQMRGSKMFGLYEFWRPHLTITDIEISHAICVKDFDHFVDRRDTNLDGEIFGEMLTGARGSHWKGMRSVMSPTFSSGKMRNMFHLVKDKSHLLLDYCDREKDAQSVVDLGDALNKYTLDVITSCAFGMETNALQGENEEFLAAAMTIFRFDFKLISKLTLAGMCKPLYNLLNLKTESPQMGIFVNCIKNTLKVREQGPRRGDFVDLLLDAKKSEGEKEREGSVSSYTMTDDSIIAQSVLFIVAGFDTTASTLKFAVHLMAQHEREQEELREELVQLTQKSDDGKLNYEEIMEGQYLDAVLAETLRLYPPGHVLERQCTKDYAIPGTNYVIPKGLVVSIPVYSFHRDERYFPDPEKFQPERFLPENKKNIHQGAYMPFGLGPRMCIAQRFALMEAKIGLAKLVLKYHLSLADGFQEIKLDSAIGIMRPLKGNTRIKIQEVQYEY